MSATAGNADIWGVDGDGNVMTWSNGWVVIPGKLLKQVDVSVSSSTLKVVGVDTTGLAWRLLYVHFISFFSLLHYVNMY